jgi:hypothetical protein
MWVCGSAVLGTYDGFGENLVAREAVVGGESAREGD